MMSDRDTFDEIYNSMVNGQRRQAIKQAIEMGLSNVPELLDYLIDDLNQPEVARDFCNAYFYLEH